MSLLFAILLSAASQETELWVDSPSAPKVSTYEMLKRAPVPVTTADITDRPYRIVAQVRAEVRPATELDGPASEAKVFDEMWERGSKLGADAVIKVIYGKPRVTLFSYGARKATGTAIKFLTDAEIAAQRSIGPVIATAPENKP